MVFPKKEMAITEKIYPSDLTDTQWNLIAPLIPKAKTGGRPRSVDMRNTLDAILYINRTGAQWRYLPEKYPPRSTVFEYFSRWQKDGTWDLMNKEAYIFCEFSLVFFDMLPECILSNSAANPYL